jgi:SAM-dependent methyltransferase
MMLDLSRWVENTMGLRAIARRVVPDSIYGYFAAWHRNRRGRRSPRQIFSEIYRVKSWGGDSQDFFSGYGSHDKGAVDIYVDAVTNFLATIPGARTVDLGCGDFNVGKRIRQACATYIACDVVPELIERNKRVFASYDVDFRRLDIISEPLPQGDVVILRQVLQHLNNSQIARVLSKLGCYRHLILTEHLPSDEFVPNLDKPTGVGIRLYATSQSGVVLTEAPFLLEVRSSRTLCQIAETGSIVLTTHYELVRTGKDETYVR